jgi:hypothetical protein
MRVAREHGDDLVVPAVVVAEVVRGKTATDALVDRALKALRQVASTPARDESPGNSSRACLDPAPSTPL